MISASFDIATPSGRHTVAGFRPTADSFLGAHDNGEGRFNVTLLHTGTSVNGLFEKYRFTPQILSARMALIEMLCFTQFCALLDLPWGCTSISPAHALAVEQIKEAAQA